MEDYAPSALGTEFTGRSWCSVVVPALHAKVVAEAIDGRVEDSVGVESIIGDCLAGPADLFDTNFGQVADSTHPLGPVRIEGSGDGKTIFDDSRRRHGSGPFVESVTRQTRGRHKRRLSGPVLPWGGEARPPKNLCRDALTLPFPPARERGTEVGTE